MRRWLVRGVLTALVVLTVTSVSLGAAAKLTVKLATAYPPGNEACVAAEKFAELLSTKSNGRIECQVFSGGAMGGERETLEALKMGSVQFVTSGMMPVHMFATKYGFFDAPFVMKDYAHWKRVWAGPLGSQVAALFRQNMIVSLGTYYRGVRHTTADKPIKTPADLKGIKMRVPQDPSWVKIWKQLGTLPTVVALPELFTALQTGVADASEGPASQLVSYRLNEVQKYLILSGHMVAVGLITANLPFLNSLSAEDRQIVLAAGKEAADYTDTWAQQAEAKLIQDLVKAGMTIVEPDKDAFREAGKPAIEELFRTEWNVTTWDYILSQ